LDGTPGELDVHYAQLAARWKTSDRTADYQKLVIPHGNNGEPLHRWFHLKEAFSSQLVDRLLKDSDWHPPRRHLRMLDPFCGGGTSLVSSLEWADNRAAIPHVVGVERNPMLRTVAAAKTAAALEGKALGARLRRVLPTLSYEYDRQLRVAQSTPSATLNNRKYFSKRNVTALLAIQKAIALGSTSESYEQAVLQTCLAAAVERTGKLRRDGRALRYEADRKPQNPWKIFESNIAQVLQDLDSMVPRPTAWKADVLEGDARAVDRIVGSRRFDWIVFSPPYPNNIDYTEVYKVESWVLGHWIDTADMRRQRLGTLRSHPSIRFPDTYAYMDGKLSEDVERLVSPLIAAIPDDRYAAGREQVIRGYADDMLAVLDSCRKVIAQDGFLTYVVGNSVHGPKSGTLVIAADLLIARLAELVGWHVEEVRVARMLRRRGCESPYLRESVVVLRPSDC
jgi:hypothetical protein